MNPVNEKYIAEVSRGTGVPANVVLDNIVTAFLARRAVELGAGLQDETLMEFCRTDEGPVGGSDLFRLLTDCYKRDIKKWLEGHLDRFGAKLAEEGRLMTDGQVTPEEAARRAAAPGPQLAPGTGAEIHNPDAPPPGEKRHNR